MGKSVLQRCAVVSGLLSRQEVDEALQLLRGNASTPDAIDDERLGTYLAESGRLNRWQVEQLKAGRTKFNLGRYQVIDSIGQGGMGQVFKAEDTVMGRIVAVKVLPRSRSTPEAITNFMREVRAQAQLAHENLVRAYDTGQGGNVHFLVTEYVPGTDLRRLVRAEGALDMNVAASIISQAARALEHAHSRGLIHRDVKPGNLLVTPDGHTKVSDLGLAGYFNEPEQIDAYGGKVVGTADYLAPEQITAPDKLTPASDIYALGCTLYYAVTGKVPFPGGNARDKAKAHCTQAPLDPRRLNDALSDEFVEVIADMMAKKPEERIQTAGEVIRRLTAWVATPLPATIQPPPLNPPPPPPVRMPAMARMFPSEMSDTEPNFLVQPAEDPSQISSPSQLSLGTQPVGSASQETVPGLQEPGYHATLHGPMPLPRWMPRPLQRRWTALTPQWRHWLTILVATSVGATVTAILLIWLRG